MTSIRPPSKNEWRPLIAPESLFGVACLQHYQTKEKTAWGELGCLYEQSPGRLAAIVYQTNGDEVLVDNIKPGDIKTWVRRLKIPKLAEDQVGLVL